MKQLRKHIEKLVNDNKGDLLNSQAQYGGVYVHAHFDEDYCDLEIELNEGTICFTIRVKDGACPHCQCEEFIAQEMVSFEIVCDAHRNVIKRNNEMSGEGTQGPYTCKECGEIYETTDELFNLENSVDALVTEVLSENGISSYKDRDSWEDALSGD